jgi:AcrR family transcriptional regulator
MGDIASVAGVAKGTVFLTFSSKEALFLSLLERELLSWFAELEGKLDKCRGVPAVVDAIAVTLVPRVLMLKLLAVLGPVLEHNIKGDEVAAFKQMLLERMVSAGSVLEIALPFLRPQQGARVFLHLDALVVGLFHQSEVSPTVKMILDAPRFAPLRVSFEEELRIAFAALLQGLNQVDP